MSTVSALSQQKTRQPLPTLRALTIAALIGNALALTYAQVGLVKSFDIGLTVFTGIMLLGAGLVAIRWRWTPLLGALLSTLVVALNGEGIFYDLTHPGSFQVFAVVLTFAALALAGLASGIGALLQGYRGASQQTPRGTWIALSILIGVCAGALLIGALPRAASAGVTPEVLAGLPALSATELRFDQAELQARAGEVVALRFDNPSPMPHSFDIDELNVHVPVAAQGQGLIMFKPSAPGTYTFYCGVPGHREAGMVGTLLVKP